MHFPEIKKFSLYEDEGPNVSITKNSIFDFNFEYLGRTNAVKRRVVTDAEKMKVVKYFNRSKYNTAHDMAKRFKMSVFTVDRIINQYIKKRLSESESMRVPAEIK